jgi:hypothetical protein
MQQALTDAVPGDADWPDEVRSRSVRMRLGTALLAVALVAAVGVYAGARLEKGHAGTTSAASGFPTGAARAGGATGGTRAGGFGGAAAAATGTVTEVTAKTLYLTSTAGKLIKVKLTAKTTFTRTAKTTTGGVTLGDTAVVQGAKNAAGVVVATSVIVTAKGVTATFGGGGFGGQAPTGAATQGG